MPEKSIPRREIPDLLREKRMEILRIARKHGVGRIQVFGSVARGDASLDSDVDFLIEVNGPTPPWFPGGLVADLEALLGRRVDVVEAESLREDIRDSVCQEAVLL
ncbi:MAG: nucleotidyltransferase domain-containing protein [Candidatus Latescibacter sp.]|nr:nucleotidyltransferase domain-containing protein [Candidatus Latescibacter sp.]